LNRVLASADASAQKKLDAVKTVSPDFGVDLRLPGTAANGIFLR